MWRPNLVNLIRTGKKQIQKKPQLSNHYPDRSNSNEANARVGIKMLLIKREILQLP